MRPKFAAFALAVCSFAAAAAPRIETLEVKPNPAQSAGGKPPEVEIIVHVARARLGAQSCDASVDPGDGSRARPVEFGVATIRAVRHVYSRNGSYRVVVKGAGKTPCEGSRETALSVSGIAEAATKAPAKKDAKKEGRKETKKKAAKKAKAPEGASASKP